MTETRVLVTGSRSWRDGSMIRQQLNLTLEDLPRFRPAGDVLVVVHGACRSGADMYADAWARWHETHDKPVRREAHPARWEDPCRPQCRPGHRRQDPRGWDVCPQAGYYRNEAMVHLGADLCLAFINDSSKGATHCSRYAEKQGIPTRRYTSTANVTLF